MKKIINSFEPLAIHILIFLAFTFLISCETDTPQISNCSVTATIRDMSGLSGCGFLLELENGEKLEPVWKDPLLNFNFNDGQSVSISYEHSTNTASLCMVGTVVVITCIQEIPIKETL